MKSIFDAYVFLYQNFISNSKRCEIRDANDVANSIALITFGAVMILMIFLPDFSFYKIRKHCQWTRRSLMVNVSFLSVLEWNRKLRIALLYQQDHWDEGEIFTTENIWNLHEGMVQTALIKHAKTVLAENFRKLEEIHKC